MESEHDEELSVGVCGSAVTVAVVIAGEGRAVELTPTEAREAARQLLECAREAEDAGWRLPILLPARASER